MELNYEKLTPREAKTTIFSARPNNLKNEWCTPTFLEYVKALVAHPGCLVLDVPEKSFIGGTVTADNVAARPAVVPPVRQTELTYRTVLARRHPVVWNPQRCLNQIH